MNLQRVFTKQFTVLCLTLLIALVGLQSVIYGFQLYLTKQPIPLNDQLYKITGDYDRYVKTQEAPRYSDAVLEELGTSDYLSWFFKRRNYTLPKNTNPDSIANQIRLHFAYYTGTIDATPHVPDRCMVAQGNARTLSLTSAKLTLSNPLLAKSPEKSPRNKDFWTVLSKRNREVKLPSNEVPVRVFKYAPANQSENPQWVIYFFISNGEFIALPEKVRLQVFDLSSKYAYWSKVEIGIPAYVKTEEEALKLAADFLSETLPEIMYCLPDWHDVLEGRYPK